MLHKVEVQHEAKAAETISTTTVERAKSVDGNSRTRKARPRPVKGTTEDAEESQAAKDGRVAREQAISEEGAKKGMGLKLGHLLAAKQRLCLLKGYLR